jgi:ABC-type polysaccharide/polyol phosphate export permease
MPLIIVIQYILSLGLIFITSSIDVYVRDAEYIVNFIVQMLFYATPILYSADIFNGSIISLIIKLNPLATIITAYRDILFYQTMPNITDLIIVLFVSILILFIGQSIFNKLKKGFAEEV